MKPRKTKELKSVLLKKGFVEVTNKKRHQFVQFFVEGKKTSIRTMFSHGLKEYSPNLMGKIKNQLRFENAEMAEDFFDCPMSEDDYVKMLIDNGVLPKRD